MGNNLTYKRYLETFENIKNGRYGTYEYYADKILIASIDEIGEEFNTHPNIFITISKFYEMLKILLFGNRKISFNDYKKELLNFETEHRNKNADEITEYIILILMKYINNNTVLPTAVCCNANCSDTVHKEGSVYCEFHANM